MAPPNSERTATPQRSAQEPSSEGLRENSFVTGAGDFSNTGNTSNLSGTSSTFPPPLPPRPANTTGFNSGYYNNYGSNFGLATNPYYGATSFPSYGYNGYNRPYGSAFYGGVETGDFVRIAEERSRNAFQSIETVVQAFSSISMMLESSMNAMYSSFRAVLGVAQHFSNLKLQLSQIVTTLAVVRYLRWLWRRLLVLCRLRPAVANADDLWRRVAGETLPTASQMLSELGTEKAGSSWSSLVFFAFVIGGPYLIWKLVSKLVASVEDQKRWATGERTHFVAVALYDFTASSSGELSIRAGQRIRLAPKELQPQVRGWILGSVDGTAIGLVPANYMKIVGKQTVDETSKPSQPLSDDIQVKNPVRTSDSAAIDLERLFDESNKPV